MNVLLIKREQIRSGEEAREESMPHEWLALFECGERPVEGNCEKYTKKGGLGSYHLCSEGALIHCASKIFIGLKNSNLKSPI